MNIVCGTSMAPRGSLTSHCRVLGENGSAAKKKKGKERFSRSTYGKNTRARSRTSLSRPLVSQPLFALPFDFFFFFCSFAQYVAFNEPRNRGLNTMYFRRHVGVVAENRFLIVRVIR